MHKRKSINRIRQLAEQRIYAECAEGYNSVFYSAYSAQTSACSAVRTKLFIQTRPVLN
jgi:hypothetical protein